MSQTTRWFPTTTRNAAIAFMSMVMFLAGGMLLAASHSNVQSSKPPASQPTSSPATSPATKPATEKLVIAGEEFDLEIAATPEARELGLMNRDHIDDHGGMLFIYAWPQVLSYWMKNCPIEMDILYINDKGVIVATHRMLPAPPRRAGQTEEQYDNALLRYESRRPAQFAIELQAGTIERLKIKAGAKIEMDLKRLATMASENANR